MGGLLATGFVRGQPRRPRIALLHGVVGAAGLGALLLVLREPAPPDVTGTGSFGVAAAWIFATALVVALLKRWAMGFMLAVHGSLAIFAWFLALAWFSLAR